MAAAAPAAEGKLHILADSGPPPGSKNYTTLVLFHGLTLHSGIFRKLLSLAPGRNARIVLLNRRDYPGATPYSDAELAPLNAQAQAADPALGPLQEFMAARAQELADVVSRFVHDAAIPLPTPAEEAETMTGGLVLVGWSFGTSLATAFLAHVASGTNTSPAAQTLSQYVRRVIFHDTPYHTLGFPLIPNPYNPLTDDSIPGPEKTRAFAAWVSGYYAHGDGDVNDPDKLERRTPLASPPPTLATLTDDERADIFFPKPGDPGGSDMLLLLGGMQTGLFADLREKALRLPGGERVAADAGRRWAEVEVRYVWCDRSVWEMPWSVWNMRAAIEKERGAGVPLRNYTCLRLRGANHFVHWDAPERALDAFLVDMPANGDLN